MRTFLKTRILWAAAWVLRKYFVGRRLYRIVQLDGFPSVQDYGKIVACSYSTKTRRLTVTFMPGQSHITSVDVSRLRREPHLKGAWAFND